MLFKSNQENGPDVPQDPHPWLEEKVYARLRQRTVDLVKSSVDVLCNDKRRVSLATIVAKSKELDAEGNGKGISESAILDNQEARAYYAQHRTWRGNRKRRAKPLAVTSAASVKPVKPDRNEQRARQRYLRMSKEALVERLLALEQTSAQERERWLTQQDEVLTWRLRAEAAEARLAQEAEVSARKTRSRTASEKKG